MRNLQNVAKRSGETAWLKSLDESQLDSLTQAYKEKARAHKEEKSKLKFSMTMYKEKTVRQTGIRKEGRRRLMNEEQYYGWAATVEGGLLSRTQAQKKWQELLLDDSAPKEGEGANDQLAIRICTDLIDYDDLAGVKEMEQSAKLSPKLSEPCWWRALQAVCKSMVWTSAPCLHDGGLTCSATPISRTPATRPRLAPELQKAFFPKRGILVVSALGFGVQI